MLGGGIMKGLLYAIIGGIISFFAFMILWKLFGATDEKGYIFIATIILSTVICCCTGILVEACKSKEEK
jgi:Na+/melibiose symporter-like transporter